MIAQDRRLRRAGAKEGAPSSKKSLFLHNYFLDWGTPFSRNCIFLLTPFLTVRPRNRNRPYLFNSERLQPVLIYHQFASAAARAFENVMRIPASTTGGQQGVIAQDRRLRRAGAKEGTPSSKKSLFLRIPSIQYPSVETLSYGQVPD